MAYTIDRNVIVESGVNTESRLVKVSVTAGHDIPIPHTLRHTPVWAQVIQATEIAVGAFPATSRVSPLVWDTIAFVYVTGGTPSQGTGTLYVHVTAPAQGTTEIVYFTLHLGRTHSRAR